MDTMQPALISHFNKEALLAKETPQSKQDAKAVAQNFESIFIHQMLNQMFENISADPLSDSENNFSQEMYRTMLLEQYGNEISKSGGFGIAQHIERELLTLQEISQ